MNLKLVSFLALCGAFAVACGDSGSNTGGGTSDDGGNSPEGGGGSTGVLGGGNPPVGGEAAGGSPPEAPDCYIERDAFIIDPAAIAATSPIGQNLCTPTQVTDFQAACFAPGDETTCMAFDTANPACFDCILGGDAAPIILPALISTTDATYVNVYACQAYATDLPQCGVPAAALVTCGQTACASCDDTEFNDCINYAINAPGICGTEVTFPAECGPVISAETLEPECDDPAVDGFDGFYIPVTNYFCGAPG